jgi:hypothetical protein
MVPFIHFLRPAISLVLVVFGSIFLPVLNSVKEAQRKRRSESWPLIHGQVRATQVISEESLPWYSTSISYAYSVSGENYPGFLEMHMPWKFLANRYIEGLESGLPVMIRYNPSSPEESVFRKDDQPSIFSRRN